MMKKIFCALALVAGFFSCTEDYTDWANPQSNAANEAAEKFVMMVEPTVSAIDFAEVTEERVQLFTTNLAEGQTGGYVVTVSADDVEKTVQIDADVDGYVSVAELEEAVKSLYGAAPVERSVNITVAAEVKVESEDGAVIVRKEVKPFVLKATPDAPFIDEGGYYLVGNIDGWSCTRVDAYHMVNNGGDVYENPEFSVTIAAVAGVDPYEVKFVPSSAFKTDGSIENWGIALSALPDVDEIANKGSFSYNNAGGNIKFAAVEGAKFYTIKANLLEGTYEVTSLSFNPFVYFIGATDGWSNAEQKLALTDDSGIYTGYLYCADPNGWGNEFKFQKVPGDWGTEINSGHMTGGISGDFADGGGNFKATAGEGVYYVTLNLNANTLNGIFVNKMGIIGDFNGWGGDVEMTWNATDYCFEATGAGVTANGWKFRINADWGINLGANDSAEPSTVLDDLVANGKNLGVAGNTIKLYPTRKTSDKIYCTVE